MHNLTAFDNGLKAAMSGELRALPSELGYKLLSQEFKDWYKGYDSASVRQESRFIDRSVSLMNNAQG